jgi:hypothetical protein
MTQELARTSLSQSHEVFDLEVVVKLSFFVGRERSGRRSSKEVPDTLAGRLGRLEFDDLARAERGDELNNLFVRSHAASFAFSGKVGKRLLTTPPLQTVGRKIAGGRPHARMALGRVF